ncbi:hypothetical protein JCM19233_1841 [Vibrio astriarenae]|nr:hypothetical protein JCM19233_1841 [Vibrio sp. C7]
MKLKLLTTALLGLVNVNSAQACLADGGVDGAIFATPQGTFEVAVAFHHAEVDGMITRSNRSNWATVQYLMLQKMTGKYNGETFDITLFDASGQHFYRFIADGERIVIRAHEVPKDQYQGVVVTDIDVIVSMVRGQISFELAQKLGVIVNSDLSSDFEHLMTVSFV